MRTLWRMALIASCAVAGFVVLGGWRRGTNRLVRLATVAEQAAANSTFQEWGPSRGCGLRLNARAGRRSFPEPVRAYVHRRAAGLSDHRRPHLCLCRILLTGSRRISKTTAVQVPVPWSLCKPGIRLVEPG